MKLYHGSTVTVKQPNLQKGRKTTDFGKGFYTTTNFEQGVISAEAAIEMLKTHKLFNQLSFHSQETVSLLEFTDAIVVSGI